MSGGTDANNSAPLTDEPQDQPHEPHIHVLKGQPTADELAALIAVLGGASGGGGLPAPPEGSRWGLPVDKLRYPIYSWQKITLLERTHMRR